MDLEELAARDSTSRRHAESRLAARVQRGAEQQVSIIKKLSEVITDRLEFPSTLNFVQVSLTEMGIQYKDGPTVTLHPNAVQNIADLAGVPRKFWATLLAGAGWERELLRHNLDMIFAQRSFGVDRLKQPTKHLHRIVNGELRCVSSRMYNRNLNSKVLLRAFIEGCAQSQAGPVEGHASDVRVWLKCMLPVVFEPIDGEFVALGVTFSNSDFRAGPLKITDSILRIKSGTISVIEGEDALHRTHLGGVISDDNVDMSSEYNQKELDTARTGVRDIVKARLSAENIERTLETIRTASELKLDWHQFKQAMRTVMSKKEMEGVEAMIKAGIGTGELPAVKVDSDGEIEADAWWASNVAGFFARDQKDPDKKADLQDLAGSFVAGKYGSKAA